MKYINKLSILMCVLLVGMVNFAFATDFRFLNETGKWIVLRVDLEGGSIPGYYAIVGPNQRMVFGWGGTPCIQRLSWAWYDPDTLCEDGDRRCLGGLEFVSGGREEYENFKKGKPINPNASERVDSHKLDRVDYQMKAANIIDKRASSRIAEAKRVAAEKGSYSLNCIDEFYRIKEGEKKFSDPIFILEQ